MIHPASDNTVREWFRDITQAIEDNGEEEHILSLFKDEDGKVYVEVSPLFTEAMNKTVYVDPSDEDDEDDDEDAPSVSLPLDQRNPQERACLTAFTQDAGYGQKLGIIVIGPAERAYNYIKYFHQFDVH